MNYILAIVLSLFSISIYSQNDTISFKSFQKYSQIQMGLSYVNFNGKVSEFTKHGGSLDLNFAEARRKHIYGFNMNLLVSNKIQEFSIPIGYEHYDNPASAFVGLFYGQTFGNVHDSHYQGNIGLSFGWLLHKKQGEDIGGYHGIVPHFEFSRSFIIGKTKYSEYQFTSQYTPMRYDPSLSNKFIDIFIGYKQLFLNNPEGKGGILSLGIRYKVNKYSIVKNLN